MRLGGPVFAATDGPESWARAVRAAGYRAASCPLGPDSEDGKIRAYAAAAREADIVIAEVGAWSNPLSDDPATRTKALDHCKACLQLADSIGARCCVNIAGSRGEKWDGPHPLNLSDETFEMIVASVRDIIDAVQPRRTFYTLETMPWIFPDSPASYLRLIQAIDRKQFAVHLDPVNLINSPSRIYDNAALLKECFAVLGPFIKGCHAKDIVLQNKLTVHLDEVRPGTGSLDYGVFLTELARLDPDTPLFLEHLQGEEEYRLAADHLRSVATQHGFEL